MDAPPAFRLVEEPKQTEVEPDGVTVTLGNAFTVTVTEFVPVHPCMLVPVTVYVCEEFGEAFTEAPVVVFNPVAGLHV